MLEFGIDRYKWKSVRAPMKGLLHKLKFIHTVSLHVQSYFKGGLFCVLTINVTLVDAVWPFLHSGLDECSLFLMTTLFPTKFV